MNQGVEVWVGGVNTWECDEMGHMNVRFYVAKSLEGLAGLAAELGLAHAFSQRAGSTLVVSEQHIRFLREAHAGAGLIMAASVIEMGETDARVLLVLRHLNGTPAASFQTVISHRDASGERAFPWPARVRARAEALKAEIPAFAAARSLSLAPLAVSEASLVRAEQLGMVRSGLTVVGARDCDAFGRMRPDMFMGWISDGIPRLTRGQRPGPDVEPGQDPPRMGGAALEYRMIFHAWPRAGDRVELRSATAECEAKHRRLVHWLLDPQSGRPWASAEAIAVALDLDARKVVAISETTLAQIRAEAIPGLGL